MRKSTKKGEDEEGGKNEKFCEDGCGGGRDIGVLYNELSEKGRLNKFFQR